MPIRLPRTSQPQDPRPQQPGGTVVPVLSIGNPAAAAARTALSAGQLAADIYQEDRDREIVARVSELDIQRRQADAAVIDGYRSLQGKAAVEKRAEAMAAIASNSRAAKAGIQDRTVADLWSRQDAALTLAAQNELDGHYRNQNIQWQADTQTARADLLVSQVERVALGDGYNPATGKLSVEAERTRSAFHDALGELGAVLGWSKERVDVERRKADTKAYGQVAESLIRAERYGEASKVLEQHADRIDVGTRDQLAQQARVGAAQVSERARIGQVRDEAARLALRLIDEAKAPPAPAPSAQVDVGGVPIDVTTWNQTMADAGRQPPKTLPAQPPVEYASALLNQALLDKKITAEMRDMTLAYVERESQARDKADAAESKQLVTDAERFLTENPLSTLADNPKLYEAAKRTGSLKGLLEFQKTGRYSTDPEVQAKVRSWTDEQLRSVPPDRLWVQLRPSLSNADLEDVMARQARASGGATPDQLHVINVNDRVEMAAREMGILPRNPDQKRSIDQQNAFEAWRMRLEGDLRDMQARTGKKASPEDLQGMLDLRKKDVVERVSKGLVWDSVEQVPLSMVPDGRAGEGVSVVVGSERIDLKRIPERRWSQIAAYLQSIGEPPTAKNIAERWAAIGRPDDIATGGGR